MNLTNLKEQLLKFGEKIGLQVHEETADQITFHTQITAKDYFINSVYCRFVAYQSGTIHLFLTFDVIESTYDNLYLINAFNENNPWFRAYITNIKDRDYLELHYAAVGLNHENEAIDTFGFLLNELLNEPVLKYLKPILNGEAE
ncbi:MAG: hypothetical protein J6N95_03740 [Bacilli bacterium]|nr:hypothetical protein [Bacilli bacterium]